MLRSKSASRKPERRSLPMDDRFLKTGVFLAPFHPLDENPLLALDRDMELLVHLDRLNYHEAWIGEHHSGGFEIIACPELFIAGAAERTRHIRLGTGVVSLPYHNPFTIAGRMMQLDYMTRGRAMFGVGPGSLVYDAVKLGLNPQDQRRKLDEALDVIVELMQGRTVTKKTDWFDLHEARLQLKSYSQPMIEMAVASNRSPVGAVAAGKHNIGMLSIGGTSDEALKAHASNWGVYEESARAAGKTPDRRKWRIVTFAHVAEAREQARADVKAWKTSNAISAKWRRSPSSRQTLRQTRPSIWLHRVLPVSARRMTACAISSDCGKARTAGSAAFCCSRIIGRIGRPPSAAMSSWRATFIRISSATPTRCATGAMPTPSPNTRRPARSRKRRSRPRSTNISAARPDAKVRCPLSGVKRTFC